MYVDNALLRRFGTGLHIPGCMQSYSCRSVDVQEAARKLPPGPEHAYITDCARDMTHRRRCCAWINKTARTIGISRKPVVLLKFLFNLQRTVTVGAFMSPRYAVSTYISEIIIAMKIEHAVNMLNTETVVRMRVTYLGGRR